MENPSLIELGAGVTATYFLLKLVFGFLKPIIMRKTETVQAPEVATLQELKDSINVLRSELHITKENTFKELKLAEKLFEMHDRKDVDGVYVWYVRASLADSVQRLAEAVDQMVKLLKEDHG